MPRSPLVLAFAFAPLAWAHAALPCSPPLPSLDGTAAPDDGGLLPLNGVVHARLSSAFGTVGASVRADGGVAGRRFDVDDIGGVSRINLDGLDASTSYTLTLMMDDDVVTEDGQQRTRAIHFTTTRTADTAPPVFDGAAPDVVVTHIPASEFVDSCGGGAVEQNAVDVFAPRVRDDVGVAGLKLIRVNDNGTRELRQFHLHSGGDGDDDDDEDEDEDEDALTDSEPTPGDYAYEIVAVDLAGNESAPLAVDVTVPGAAGCSAGGAAPPFAFALVLLLLANARRARMQS